MKVCVSGKGGVGKTLISAALARVLSGRGYTVWAIDADPDMNLGLALGVEGDVVPLMEMRDLIMERTGGGVMIRMNPEVGDIPERFYRESGGVRLLVLGGVSKGGGGCACPENVFLKALINHMVLLREEALVVDLEAGLEPLGRATVMGVDWLVIVLEATEAAVSTVHRIRRLAGDLGIKRIGCILNKSHGEEDVEFVRGKLPFGVELLGVVGYIERLRRGYGVVDEMLFEMEGVVDRLMKGMKR